MHSSLGDAVRPIWRRLGVLFPSIASPWFNACARVRVRNALSRQSFLALSRFGAGADFGAKPGEFFASQRQDGIVATSYGDAVDGLYWVGALQSAHDSYPPAQQGIAVAERVFLVL
jgi:hypothetical protein